MGPAWLGLLGAVVGGVVTLAGTLITTRVQWRQERARLLEQRRADIERRENEERRDTTVWARTRDDEKANWLREQKLTSYLTVLDHLLAAGELASKLPLAGEDDRQPFPREDELAIVQELRKSHRWLKSASAVCGEEVTRQLKELAEELYFTIQVISYEGIQRNKLVRRPENRDPNPWLLVEVIDRMSERVSDISRSDLGAV